MSRANVQGEEKTHQTKKTKTKRQVEHASAATMWEYDEASNYVIFAEGHGPAEGQTIRLDYAVWGCGE